jgi:outer membrane protein TolC
VLTLTGCAVGPHYVKPVLSVNNSWSGTGSPQISAQPATDSSWWKAFNDPVLEQLIQLAYRQNLTLRVAGLRIMEARAVLGITTGNQYPQVQQAFVGVSGVGLSDNTANKLYAFTWTIYQQASGTSNEVNNASIAFANEDQSTLSEELINAFYPPRFQFGEHRGARRQSSHET